MNVYKICTIFTYMYLRRNNCTTCTPVVRTPVVLKLYCTCTRVWYVLPKSITYVACTVTRQKECSMFLFFCWSTVQLDV